MSETTRYFCPTAEEVESQPDGGFNQCCDRPDFHVPLPEGEGTEKLSQILSDRAKRLYQEAQSAAHPPKQVDGKWEMWPQCDDTECGWCR